MNSKTIQIDDKEIKLDGVVYTVRANVLCERKAVDHKHNPMTGQGRDVFGFVAVSVSQIEVYVLDFVCENSAIVKDISEILIETLNNEGIE